MSSLYDGWLNLGERVGSKYEYERANVDESYIAIYAKKYLNDNLLFDQKIVGEYYYVRYNKGYIITIETKQELWSKIQKSVKHMIDSFWVGEGTRPSPTKSRAHISSGWDMSGQNASNQNSIFATPNLTTSQVKWDYHLDQNYRHSSLIVSREVVYFSSGKNLYSLSL